MKTRVEHVFRIFPFVESINRFSACICPKIDRRTICIEKKKICIEREGGGWMDGWIICQSMVMKAERQQANDRQTDRQISQMLTVYQMPTVGQEATRSKRLCR